MKLEVPNKDYKNTYWLATIIAKASPLILVRYEGFKETNNADFWCNTLTDDIHPVGWCARSKHALKPPKGLYILLFFFSKMNDMMLLWIELNKVMLFHMVFNLLTFILH